MKDIVHSLIKMSPLVFLNTSKKGKHREGVCGDIRVPWGWGVGGPPSSLVGTLENRAQQRSVKLVEE